MKERIEEKKDSIIKQIDDLNLQNKKTLENIETLKEKREILENVDIDEFNRKEIRDGIFLIIILGSTFICIKNNINIINSQDLTSILINMCKLPLAACGFSILGINIDNKFRMNKIEKKYHINADIHSVISRINQKIEYNKEKTVDLDKDILKCETKLELLNELEDTYNKLCYNQNNESEVLTPEKIVDENKELKLDLIFNAKKLSKTR